MCWDDRSRLERAEYEARCSASGVMRGLVPAWGTEAVERVLWMHHGGAARTFGLRGGREFSRFIVAGAGSTTRVRPHPRPWRLQMRSLSSPSQSWVPPRVALMGEGRYFLYSDERDLRTMPAMETAAPRTMASEAMVMMDTGGDITVVCGAMFGVWLVRMSRRSRKRRT